MTRKIAIVEDDRDQRENYMDALTRHGYEVWGYANRRTAMEAFQLRMPDLAILDIMLEDEMDGGFDLCRELRALAPHLPIIFLTSRDSDIDRVSALRMDAWDYLTKPVTLQYLAVRISSLFRIVESINNPAPDHKLIRQDELELDLNSMSARWRGESLSLTLTEFWIVEALARRPGHVKTYDGLMQVTRQSYVEKNSINTYLRRIRNKFRAIDAEFSCIETVYGLGYRWQNKNA